jgi:hypothetical protein
MPLGKGRLPIRKVIGAAPFRIWNADEVSEVSFRRLSIGDLDEPALRRLIAEGETLFVERKQKEPSGGFGPAVASFANTLGGWLLLGIGDDRSLKGYDAGQGDFTDKIRHKLRSQVEPLPPFAADTFQLDGVEIAVIRVTESTDTPHIVLGTGAVPIREPGGTRNIASHAELVDLARRGERARTEAEGRLDTLPFVHDELTRTDPGGRVALQGFAVRAAPLTRPDGFADRVLSISFGTSARQQARELFPGPPFADPKHRVEAFSFAQRGFNITATQMGAHERSSVIADAGGVLVARTERPKPLHAHGTQLRPEGVEEEIMPLLEVLVELFERLDTQGRAVCDLLVRGFAGAGFTHQRAGSGLLESDLIHIGGEMTMPPDEGEMAALALRWTNELARAAGLEVWQDLPD